MFVGHMLPVESTSSLEEIIEAYSGSLGSTEESQVPASFDAAGMPAHTLNRERRSRWTRNSGLGRLSLT